eukprot:jgi/Botrbrau1/9841/Bobra.0313s0016.4
MRWSYELYMDSDRPAAPHRNPAEPDVPNHQEDGRHGQNAPRSSPAAWQGLSISATNDTATQYEGSAQISVPSSQPIEGHMRVSFDQQAPTSPERAEANEEGPVPGANRNVDSGLEEPFPKRMKVTARVAGQVPDTGQSPAKRPFVEGGLQSWQSAPVAEKRGTGRVSLPASPPSFHKSCPPHYLTSGAQLAKLPSRRSMPIGDQGQEAFADLKPSRSVPEHPQGNEGDELEEGIQTQLSRRSSNSKRSWPRGRGLAGQQQSFRIYSNQYEEAGQGADFLDTDVATCEQGREADESRQRSPSPEDELQQAGPQQRNATGKKVLEGTKSPRDLTRTYRPRTKDRRGGRGASSTETRRRGGTPLHGRLSTGKSGHPGRTRTNTINEGGRMESIEVLGPLDRGLGLGFRDASLQAGERNRRDAGRGQGNPELGREDVQYASFGSVPTAALGALKASEQRMLESDDQPFLTSLGSSQNAAQGTNVFSPTMPQVSGPALPASRGLTLPQELQSFLLSLITFLGHVEDQSLPQQQVFAEAANLKSQATNYLVSSLTSAASRPVRPAPPAQGPQLDLPRMLMAALDQAQAQTPNSLGLRPALPSSVLPQQPADRRPLEHAIQPVEDARVVFDTPHLPALAADNPFARAADTRGLQSKRSELDVPRAMPSAPAPLGLTMRMQPPQAGLGPDSGSGLLPMAPSMGREDQGARLVAPQPIWGPIENLMGFGPELRTASSLSGSVLSPVCTPTEREVMDQRVDPRRVPVARLDLQQPQTGKGPQHVQAVTMGSNIWDGSSQAFPLQAVLQALQQPMVQPSPTTLTHHSGGGSAFEAVPGSRLERRLGSAFFDPSPSISTAGGTVATSGPLLKPMSAPGHGYVIAAGPTSTGSDVRSDSHGPRPPTPLSSRGGPVSIQVIGAEAGKAMSTPRPTGAISLQDQTVNYRIPPLISIVSPSTSNRVYTYGPGSSAPRPRGRPSRDMPPSVSEVQSEPDSSGNRDS